jgi:hypothetical protein
MEHDIQLPSYSDTNVSIGSPSSRHQHFHLPTMKELEDCFTNMTNLFSGKFMRRKTHSISVEPNSQLLCSTPPHIQNLMKSNSDSKSIKQVVYDFYCRNTSSNLETIVNQSGVSINYNDPHQPCHITQLSDSDFDVNDRIIPEYYINKDGIKVGALQFNFSDSIVDSVRNMRTLSKYQILYLDRYSHEELKHIIMEYNNVIQTMIDNIEDI